MSDILRRASLVNRQVFDPTNPEHVESFKVFLRTGNWGNVQFYPEVPYIEVPMTVMMRYARHALNVTAETDTERAARHAANPRLVAFPKAVTTEQRLAAAAAALARANELANELLKTDRAA